MPKQSGLMLRVQREMYQQKMETQRFTRQLMCDLAMIALSNTFGFGPERCHRFLEELVRVFTHYSDKWASDTPDTEYARECIDRRLREICGEYFKPWEERYT